MPLVIDIEYGGNPIFFDMDGDGDLDMRFSTDFGAFTEVHSWNALSSSYMLTQTLTEETIQSIVVDLNEDGIPDAVSTDLSASATDEVRFRPGTGSGFGPSQVLFSSPTSDRLLHYDIDSDGDQDLMITSRNSDRIFWFANQGDGLTWGPSNLITAGIDVTDIGLAGDLENDGTPEFFAVDPAAEELFSFSIICSAANAPADLMSSVNPSSVSLSWTPFTGSQGCQIEGTQLTPPGPTGYAISSTGTTTVPNSVLGEGSTWTWRARCACSISPLIASPFSVADTFTTTSLRELETAASDLILSSTSDYVSVLWNSTGADVKQSELQILDMQGRTLFIGQINSGNPLQVSTGDWPVGTYFAVLADRNNSQAFTVNR